MSCINKSHPDYIKLTAEAEARNIPEHTLSARVSLWHSVHGTDRFPTIDEVGAPMDIMFQKFTLPYAEAVEEFKKKYNLRQLYRDVEAVKTIINSARKNSKYDEIQFGIKSSSSGFSVVFNEKSNMQQITSDEIKIANDKLDKKMKDLLKALGISVKAAEEIRDSNGNPVTAIAAARLLEKIVEVVEGKAKIDTLPEEAAHFFIRALGKDHALYKMMYNNITSQPIYAKVVAEYGDAYNMDEAMLREEAMGKMVAKAIVGQFESDQAQSWWTTLWKWIKSKLGLISSQDVRDAYAEVADMMLQLNVSETIQPLVAANGGKIFYQLDEKAKVGTIRDILNAQNLVEGRTDDQAHYIIGSELYRRVSNVLPNTFTGESSNYENARTAGTAVDTIGRDFFHKNGNVTKPEGMSDGAFQAIIKKLTALKAQFDANGETPYTNNIVLYDKENKVAGEVDIITVDKAGKFRIYDFKTGTKKSMENFEKYKRTPYTLQLSAYSNLLYNQFNISAEELVIVPFEISYDEKGNVKFANGIENKTLVYSNTVDKFIARKDAKEKLEGPFKAQIAYIKREINRIRNIAKSLPEGSPKKEEFNQMILALTNRLNQAISSQNRESFVQLGTELLESTEKDLEGKFDLSAFKLEQYLDIVDAWIEFSGTKELATRILTKAYPLINKKVVDMVNRYATREESISLEEIMNQTTDINRPEKWFSALSDSANLIARTAGDRIKDAQNEAARNDKEFVSKLKPKFDAVIEWGKSNGLNEEQVWDIFIKETKKTIGLITPEDPEYKRIAANKVLLDFYEFYTDAMKKISERTPNSITQFHIANVKKSEKSVQWNPATAMKEALVREDSNSSFQEDERTIIDRVPIEYNVTLPADQKSRHLAESLYILNSYANKFDAMSKALPEVRILQRAIAKEIKNGEVVDRMFKTSSNKSNTIKGSHTNLYQQLDGIIRMQVLGQMKKDEFRMEFGDGKYIYGSDVVDFALKYNSLLRIGLSPITATSNIIFGELSNRIEAVGGRFFNNKELSRAGMIYAKQATKLGKETDKMTDVQDLFVKLNPLQEMSDYEQIDKVRLRDGLNRDRILEKAYALQKMGEHYLQTRTMIAVLLHDGIIDNDGNYTDKGKKLTSTEINKLSNKVQRLNQMIHGRYTTKEAALLSQYAAFRYASQFKKWLSTAVEVRLGGLREDNRLGVEIEGRYRTLNRLVLSNWRNPGKALGNLLSGLRSAKAMVESGKMTELDYYNMRKNLTEITLFLAGSLLFVALKGGDDDKEWRKNPAVKTALTLLDRAAGDLGYFYTTKPITELKFPMAKTISDLIKVATNFPTLFTGETIESGQFKGWNKEVMAIMGATPGLRVGKEVIGILNDNTLDLK